MGTCSESVGVDNRVVLISRLQFDTLIDQSQHGLLISLLAMEQITSLSCEFTIPCIIVFIYKLQIAAAELCLSRHRNIL